MEIQHTNEIELDEQKTDKLVKLLKMVERADEPKQAVWLQPESRELVGEMREEIEEQTQ